MQSYFVPKFFLRKTRLLASLFSKIACGVFDAGRQKSETWFRCGLLRLIPADKSAPFSLVGRGRPMVKTIACFPRQFGLAPLSRFSRRRY